ncbi:MAG: hypothetical protein FE78DRAFT_29194 [Acidomyces sp. 'richmondensis']|nr:MAG: hypothetical protein FE78DRAFT_29194 [Acidomyces sp. 'richmondensis']
MVGASLARDVGGVRGLGRGEKREGSSGAMRERKERLRSDPAGTSSAMHARRRTGDTHKETRARKLSRATRCADKSENDGAQRTAAGKKARDAEDSKEMQKQETRGKQEKERRSREAGDERHGRRGRA